MSVMMPVQFTKSQTIERRGYSAGETAAFDDETAAFLISSGVAQRVPKAQHPLVSAALQYPDPEVRELAAALQGIGPTLQDLEMRASSLRDNLTRAKATDARALALNQPYDPKVTGNIQNHLDVLERQIATLLDQEAPLFEELREKVTAGFQRQAAAILSTDLTPALRAIADVVKKMRPIFETIRLKKAGLDAVRSAAALAGLDQAVLDQMVTAACADLLPESSVTGQTPIPDDLGSLLAGMAARQVGRGRTF